MAHGFAGDLLELERLVTRHHLATLSLHGVSVGVSSDDRAALGALQFVFSSQADVRAPTQPAAWRVGSFRSNRLTERWSQLHSATARAISSREVRRWGGDSPAKRIDVTDELSIVLHTQPFPGLTVFSRPRKMLVYLRRETMPLNIPHFEHSSKYPLRIQNWARRKIEIHAAACRYRGRGLLLIGFRRAGKTTLAMHLLARGGFMVGSDLGLLSAGSSGWLLEAIPHMCRIAPATAEDNDSLRAALARFSGNLDYLDGPVSFDSKIELYAGAMEMVFGRPVNRSRTSIEMLVFPEFDLGCSKPVLTAIEESCAKRTVHDRLRHDKPLPDWLPFTEVECRETLEAPTITALKLAQPPAFAYRFGRASTMSWNEFDAAVDRLPRRRFPAGRLDNQRIPVV